MTPSILLWVISNDPVLLAAMFRAGVDRVLVDLERDGKAVRQAGSGLFLSDHTMEDVSTLRPVVPTGALFVRVDPWSSRTVAQAEEALARGADGLMLPYFRTPEPVLRLVDAVRGRAAICPLVETAGAIRTLPALLGSRAVGEFHVGLNDLALDLGRGSLQDLWGDPILDGISADALAAAVPFGIGGVTDPRDTTLAIDAAWVIAEQRRLASTRALLGRSFRRPFEANPDPDAIREALAAIRAAYATQPQPG